MPVFTWVQVLGSYLWYSGGVSYCRWKPGFFPRKRHEPFAPSLSSCTKGINMLSFIEANNPREGVS